MEVLAGSRAVGQKGKRPGLPSLAAFSRLAGLAGLW